MPYWYVIVWINSNATGVVVEARDDVEAKWKGMLLMYQKGICKQKDVNASVYSVLAIEDSILDPSYRSLKKEEKEQGSQN